ncbi:MAG: hypothetical protein LBP19_06110 [Treponema sp.]|jgi:hypothetical protein|nr:hypothetical protein [Treponema sp.]
MNDYENQLDEIRIKLFEETNGMGKNEIIQTVNSHAQKIAQEFGIHIVKENSEKYSQTVSY